LLHATLPSSLSEAADALGLAPPHRIGIAGAFTPNDSDEKAFPDATAISLLAFDAAGRPVADDVKGQLITAGAAFNGAIQGFYPLKYQPHIGAFRSTYYEDHRSFDVDLDRLFAQGISSIAVAMTPGEWDRLAEFKRKAVRIVDPESKTEIALSHVVAPWVSTKWGMLVGGLVFVNDGWSWVPAGDFVVKTSAPDYQARWYQRLLQAQCVIPQ
jgi:hypothetical protein